MRALLAGHEMPQPLYDILNTPMTITGVIKFLKSSLPSLINLGFIQLALHNQINSVFRGLGLSRSEDADAIYDPHEWQGEQEEEVPRN